MNAAIVADGRVRLLRATEAKTKLRHAEFLREIEARHAEELGRAGAWKRWLVRRRIRKEAAARLRPEFPSAHALFWQRGIFSSPMKMKCLLLAGVLFATLSSVVASEVSAMLLKAKSATEKDRVVVAIDATVIIGEMQVSAAEIMFDQERKTMTCAGEATIRSNGATIKAQGATIEIGERRVFLLSAGVITSPEGQADFGFANQSVQPTPGAVPPPAAQEQRQP